MAHHYREGLEDDREPPELRIAATPQPENAVTYPHYFKRLPPGATHIDVYRVLELYEVTSQPISHAIKKLLCAGKRGAKDPERDVQEAIDSLKRWQQMRQEESATTIKDGVCQVCWQNVASRGHHPDCQKVRIERFSP